VVCGDGSSTSASGGSGRNRDAQGDGGGTGIERSRLVGCALGSGGDPSAVGHAGDGAERLRGLLVGGDNTVSASVDTWEVLVVTSAAQEDIVNIGSGGIVGATDTIKDVLAVVGGVSTCGVASLEAELSSTHKVVPFDGLDVVGSTSGAKGLGEEEGTERVSSLISTVGVEFSSRIIGSEVNVLLGDITSDLDVVGGLDELDTRQGTSGDDTSTIAGLCAPSDGFTLSVSNKAVGFWGTPQAKVIDAVDDGGLAERGWALGSAVAQVVPGLDSSFTIVGIGLVGKSSPGKVLGGKRDARLGECDGQKTRDECDGGSKRRHFYLNRYVQKEDACSVGCEMGSKALGINADF
jgi:hypothetical protein